MVDDNDYVTQDGRRFHYSLGRIQAASRSLREYEDDRYDNQA